MLPRHAVGLAEIGLDVLADRHGPLPPVGEEAEGGVDLEHPVGAGDEGEAHHRLEEAAQERRDTGVGVDHVGLLPGDDPPQTEEGLEHEPDVSPVHGGLVVADPGLLQLGNVDAAVGDHGDVVPHPAKLLGQLHHMGLRPADLQAHEGHQNLSLRHRVTSRSPRHGPAR